jgi:hypothetical protein
MSKTLGSILSMGRKKRGEVETEREKRRRKRRRRRRRKKIPLSWVWWFTPVIIPALRRLKQED